MAKMVIVDEGLVHVLGVIHQQLPGSPPMPAGTKVHSWIDLMNRLVHAVDTARMITGDRTPVHARFKDFGWFRDSKRVTSEAVASAWVEDAYRSITQGIMNQAVSDLATMRDGSPARLAHLATQLAVNAGRVGPQI